jgi:hypothetical protein
LYNKAGLPAEPFSIERSAEPSKRVTE